MTVIDKVIWRVEDGAQKIPYDNTDNFYSARRQAEQAAKWIIATGRDYTGEITTLEHMRLASIGKVIAEMMYKTDEEASVTWHKALRPYVMRYSKAAMR